MKTEQLKEFKDLFERVLSNELKNVSKTEPIGVALSSGIDSNAVLFGLIHLGYNVVGYTYYRTGHHSYDYLVAKKTCENLGIPHVGVEIKDDLDFPLIKHLIKDHDFKLKTAIEVLYIMNHVFEKMHMDGIKVAFCGCDADDYFCISKKAQIHYKTTLELNQEFRKLCFDSIEFGPDGFATNVIWDRQLRYWKVIAEENSIDLKMPYNRLEFFNFFWDKTWQELNQPKQKYPLWSLYPDFVSKSGKLTTHIDLQCGDTNIREIFEVLLKDKKLNVKKRNRMMDLYRDFWENWKKGTTKLSQIIED